MSCSTLNNQVGLNVAVGNLPEGFCPSSEQERLQSFAARLIVTPNQSFNGFAVGGIEPSSNVGPWLKDCLELFVFDDATARYIPIMTRGNFTNQQVLSTSGTFTVPDFTYRIKVTAWGGGGGGFNDASVNPQSGGSGGGRGIKTFAVLPAQNISFTIGTGGMNGNPATDGGDTVFLTLTAGGGKGGVANVPVIGGVVTGADFGIQGGASGHPAPSEIVSAGGDSPGGGAGGQYSNVPASPTPQGIVPGGGGSGGYAGMAGNGANGLILVEY